METDRLIHKELTYRIIGIMYKVHTSLGCGFPEKIYRRAMEIELQKEEIEYETEKEIKARYEGKNIGALRLDFVVDDKVILELKAVERLAKVFREQLISQLKAAPYEVGLLVNFGSPRLEYIRVVRKKSV